MRRSQLFITNETRPVSACFNGSVKCRLTARIERPPPRSNRDDSRLVKNRTRFLPCLPTSERVTHQPEVAFGEVFTYKRSSVVLLSEGCAAICGTGVHIPLSPINGPLQSREDMFIIVRESIILKHERTCACIECLRSEGDTLLILYFNQAY